MWCPLHRRYTRCIPRLVGAPGSPVAHSGRHSQSMVPPAQTIHSVHPVPTGRTSCSSLSLTLVSRSTSVWSMVPPTRRDALSVSSGLWSLSHSGLQVLRCSLPALSQSTCLVLSLVARVTMPPRCTCTLLRQIVCPCRLAARACCYVKVCVLCGLAARACCYVKQVCPCRPIARAPCPVKSC